ncbi:MAG: serine/threonine protein kinase [Mariniblastus sp.]|jgi:serine/threonine protein kinase
MSKISKTDFLDGLKKSALLNAKEFASLNEEVLDSAEAVAKYLIREKLATKWQAKYLLSGRSRLDIGNYRLLERIQRDEFGDRFFAIHKSLDRKVDLQILPGELTKDKTACDEFIQKASLAATLDHPNLVHVYDIDQEGGRYCLVTEHIQGQTIDQSDQENLDGTTIARIIQQAIAGIQYAHDQSVIHGSIGTSDLVLDEQQQLKIQHIPLAPLRKHTPDAPTVDHDFRAIAKIGKSLASQSKLVTPDQQNTLAAAFNDLNLSTLDSIAAAVSALSDLAGQVGESTGLTPPIINTDPLSAAAIDARGGDKAPVLRTPRKKQASSSTSRQDDDYVPGYFSRRWQDNPVALIATSAVIVGLLVGGSIIAGKKLLDGQRGGPTDSAANVLPDNSNPTDKESKLKPNSAELSESTESSQPSDEAGPTTGDAGPTEANTKKNAKDQTDSHKPALVVTDTNDKQTNVSAVAQSPDTDPQAPKTTESSPRTKPEQPADNPAKEPQLHENLTEVSGIGPATQDSLYKGDVKSLEHLASLSPQEIRAALHRGGKLNDNRTDIFKEWIVQAKEIVGDKSPVSTKTVAAGEEATAPATFAPNNLTGPFAKFPRTVGLPDITDLTETKIGDLVIKPQYLLGAEIVCAEGFAKGNFLFELNRTKNDKQKWWVGYKKNPKQKPISVATIRKSDKAVFFQWLPTASENRNVAKQTPYLQNCFLKLILPDNHETFVTLRQPIRIPDLRITQDNFSNQVRFELPALPRDETLVVEVLPMKIPNVPSRVANNLIEESSPAIIWLKNDDKTGFLWIQVSGELNSKITLESNLTVLVQGKAISVINQKAIDHLYNTLASAAIQSQRMTTITKPPGMQKGDFDSKMAALVKDAKAKQALKTKMAIYKVLLPKFLNKPVSVRVYSKLGNIQTVLAVTDPKLFSQGKKKK